MHKLHAEQRYVKEIALGKGIEACLQYHSSETKTCQEKADLLGWEPERVIKTIYFQDGDHYIGIVAPEFGKRLEVKKILTKVFPEISKKKAKRYTPSHTPQGMAYGTCTPFPHESSMDKDVHQVIFYDHPSIDDKLVDISVGGDSPEAFKTSMHIPYKGIYDILVEKFGSDKILKYSPTEPNNN